MYLETYSMVVGFPERKQSKVETIVLSYDLALEATLSLCNLPTGDIL